MSGVDTRHVNRDSLFLMAEVQVDGDAAWHRVRVRNLSAGGMMAEGDVRVQSGMRITVGLKNLSPVEGSVAWVHQQRFGIAFADEIDPKAPRVPVSEQEAVAPRYLRSVSVAPNAERYRTI